MADLSKIAGTTQTRLNQMYASWSGQKTYQPAIAPYNPLANLVRDTLPKSINPLDLNYTSDKNYLPYGKLGTPETTSSQPANENNSITAGQWVSLASDAAGMFGDYLQTRYNVKAYKQQAASYEQQILLNQAAAAQTARNMAEQNLAESADVSNYYNTMQGQQIASMAASGFDMDQRVVLDTRIKRDDALYLANRSTQLQMDELMRQTAIENIRLQAAADSARKMAKYTKIAGYIGMAAGFLNMASNFLSYGSKGSTKDVGVRG